GDSANEFTKVSGFTGGTRSELDASKDLFNAMWLVGNPAGSTVMGAQTGERKFGGINSSGRILEAQGFYSYSALGTGAAEFFSFDASNVDEFSFEINFSDGSIDNGKLVIEVPSVTSFGGSHTIRWSAGFGGSSSGSILSGSIINDATDIVANTNLESDLGTALEGELGGFFTEDSSALSGVAFGFNVRQPASSSDDGNAHVLFGNLLLSGASDSLPMLTLPESTVDEHNISWGSWNNPIEDNWVVVTPEVNGQVELQTANHLAEVTPTPVANLQGTANYETTIASSFIGSGSAGDVTQVVAGMNVDFNTGAISDGSLQVQVAGSQAWDIAFDGTVNAGMVDLNSLGGTLSDPGGMISNSIDANLGGVFTGNNAEAFVGGFDLIDEINALNHVDGIYTIER
ncbi:MAG: hypothetical protein MI746_16790, partial [Pseudomonadales bacterium]|nr:hypothetical protein [Pseudomonadales bacterium]